MLSPFKARIRAGSAACGSHVVMQRQILGQTTTVPVPLHDEIRIGTLQSIIRQSGIGRSEFEV